MRPHDQQPLCTDDDRDALALEDRALEAEWWSTQTFRAHNGLPRRDDVPDPPLDTAAPGARIPGQEDQ